MLEDVKGKHWSTFNKPKSSAMTKMMCGGRAAVPPVVVVVAQRLHKSSSELRSIVYGYNNAMFLIKIWF